MGSPKIAAIVLKNILSFHKISAVYTKPPTPKNRGLKVSKSYVHEEALKNNIAVFYPENFQTLDEVEKFQKQNFDLAIVVAYGLILPKEIFNSPKFGSINLHASLLPKWRGAAPIERAIEKGDCKTGVTIMYIDEKLDTGDIIYQEDIPLTKTSTATEVYEEMAKIGSNLLLRAIDTLKQDGNLPRCKQNNSLATYAKMLRKEDGKINFNDSATSIIQKINAFSIFPGSYFSYNNEIFKIIEAEIISVENFKEYILPKEVALNNTLINPGKIFFASNGMYITTKDNVISIKKIQRSGKKELTIKDFLIGYKH